MLACVRVEDTLVLGTTQGLATVRDGTVVHCEGLHTPVHLLQVNTHSALIITDTSSYFPYVQHIPSLRLLLLGTGGDGLQSQLVTLHSRPVVSGAGPLEPEAIPDITRCHIFSCSENSQVGT